MELSGDLVGLSGTAGRALSQGGLELTGGLGVKGGTKLWGRSAEVTGRATVGTLLARIFSPNTAAFSVSLGRPRPCVRVSTTGQVSGEQAPLQVTGLRLVEIIMLLSYAIKTQRKARNAPS